MSSSSSSSPPPPSFRAALAAGALAGTTVDLSLFPLDTLKTRLQSSAGFFAAGGFSGIYRGVGSALVGSAPGAAFFFCTYEAAKDALSAAGAGRLAAVWRELYRGWAITVFRELPFTAIQFPLWEAMKAWSRKSKRQHQGASSSQIKENSAGADDVSAVEGALFGSLAGAVAAASTTPLDVLKTRVMLSKERVSIRDVFRTMARNEGVRPFFAGIVPRVTWISLGGAIFLGSYQWAINLMR
ncbi:hypothetical protein HIM_01599 [Hirsutella minnesotensis 3608]|nr:hypothetical protein HIM_01599 [Hirsutella minnesotensis 3608]